MWQLKIIKTLLLPYLGYLVVSLWFIKVSLDPDVDGQAQKSAYVVSLGVANLLLWAY